MRTPWSWNGWKLEDTSENHKRDEEIVMAAVMQNEGAIKSASEELW